MARPHKPRNDAARLRALERAEIVGSKPEPEFDAIARRAAEACDAPIGLVTFVTADKQWVKAAYGVDLRETSREISFCAWAIHSEDVLCVEDASQDERFRDNPLVVQEPNIRFYAGAPIPTPEGYLLGAVCVIDREARPAALDYASTLQDCAAQVSHLLARRRPVAPTPPGGRA